MQYKIHTLHELLIIPLRYDQSDFFILTGKKFQHFLKSCLSSRATNVNSQFWLKIILATQMTTRYNITCIKVVQSIPHLKRLIVTSRKVLPAKKNIGKFTDALTTWKWGTYFARNFQEQAFYDLQGSLTVLQPKFQKYVLWINMYRFGGVFLLYLEEGSMCAFREIH